MVAGGVAVATDTFARTAAQAHGGEVIALVIGPGVGAECLCQAGLHIFEDHFYPEIIDPATCEPLPDGAEGELVLLDHVVSPYTMDALEAAGDARPDARAGPCLWRSGRSGGPRSARAGSRRAL